jgi:type I restriction enzyme, S subunit
MFFNRPEFDRYARFNSWGSAREVFSFEDMKKVSLPLPSMALQKAYSDLFLCYKSRAHLESKVRFLNNRFCPLLIDRAIKEGSL